MRQINATKGLVVIVDDDDYEELSAVKWHASSEGYARNSKLGMMHRYLMGNPKGQVDHINGNRSDNRRANLRLATQRQNMQNRHYGWGTSKYRGVIWSRNHDAWQVRIKVNGKSIYLGLFRSEIEAAEAYNAAKDKYFGEYAGPNEIDGYTNGEEMARRVHKLPSRPSQTGFRGVSRDKERDCYLVQIKSGDTKRAKRFTSEIAAAIWYNEQANEFFGERAILNDIPHGHEEMSIKMMSDPLAFTPKNDVASRHRGVFRNGRQWMVRIRKDNKTLFQKNYQTEDEAASVARDLIAQHFL